MTWVAFCNTPISHVSVVQARGWSYMFHSMVLSGWRALPSQRAQSLPSQTRVARQLRGIGAEPSLRPYAVQCQALGLLYVWGNGGQGLLALAQIICGVLTLWGALPLEEESDDRFPL